MNTDDNGKDDGGGGDADDSDGNSRVLLMKMVAAQHKLTYGMIPYPAALCQCRLEVNRISLAPQREIFGVWPPLTLTVNLVMGRSRFSC